MSSDKYNHVHELSYCSKKPKRIVRSTMAGEIFVFSAAFDKALVIRYNLQLILRIEIGLRICTDSKQLFDSIMRGAHTTGKRLLVEIMAREAYNRYELSNVGLVLEDFNPAEGLTKSKMLPKLNELLHQGIDNTQVSQWIYRMKDN